MIPKNKRMFDRLPKTAMALAGLALLFAEVAPALAQCPSGYTVQILEGPQCGGGDQGHIYGLGLNDLGEICGATLCPPGQHKAFVSTDGQSFTHLAFPPGTTFSIAFDRNNAGVTVGDYVPNIQGFGTLGYLRDGETFISLGTLPGGTTSEVGGLNNNNIVVGSWGNVVTGPFPLAFRWESGVMLDISKDLEFPSNRALDISDTGIITGWMGINALSVNHRGFIWDKGKVVDLGLPFPDALASEGLAVNSRGDVAGRWRRPSQTYPYETRMFLYTNGQMLDLGGLGNFQHTVPLDMNDSGTIVGTCFARAFIWSDGVFRKLNDLVDLDPINFPILEAWAINESGQIVAIAHHYPDPDTVTVLLTPRPSKPGDANCDSDVDVDDLLGVINEWGNPGGSADLNSDGLVNVSDLLEVIMNWSS